MHAGIEVQNGERDSEFRWGTKFVLLGTRPDNVRNNRVVADPTFAATASATTGHSAAPHIDHCTKRGLTVLSPVHDGTAKPVALTQIACACGDIHDLWTENGCICERQILDTGDKHLQPCPTGKIFSRRNTDTTYRWYVEFAAPSCGTVHRQRIDTTTEDRERGHNRAEHLRQHIKTDDGDSVYDRCYGWREDSESLNNTPDRALYGGRMIAYSAVRQLTVMLGFALGRNAIAAYLHRRRQPQERAA